MKRWIVTLKILSGTKKVAVFAANETEASEVACSMNGVGTSKVIKVRRALINRIK